MSTPRGELWGDWPIETTSGHPIGWMAVAHRAGRFVRLTPRYIRPSGTRDELLDRVRLRCGMDPEFAARFDGWQVYAVRFDDCVFVKKKRGFKDKIVVGAV